MFKKEELPEYFDNIIFQDKLALMESYYYITDIYDDLKIRRIRKFEDLSLTKILINNRIRINKDTKKALIKFGKLINSIVSYCDLDKKSIYIECLPEDVVILSKTKEGKLANIVFNDMNEFKVATEDTTKLYQKYPGFSTGDVTDFSHCYDDTCDITLVETGIIKEEELDNENVLTFESEKVNSVCREYSYYLEGKGYSLNTVVDSGNSIDEEGLLSHIKNLKLPVDILTFVKEIGEKYLVLSRSNLRVVQETTGIEPINDVIEVDDGNLIECHLSTYVGGGVLDIGSSYDEWNYERDFVSSNEDDLTNFKIYNSPNYDSSMEVYVKSSGAYEEIPTCKEVYKEAREVYKRTLGKLPSWIKIN